MQKKITFILGDLFYFLISKFQTSCFSMAGEALGTAESASTSRTRVLPSVTAHRAEGSCGASGGQSCYADVGGRVVIIPAWLSCAVCVAVDAGEQIGCWI